MVQYHETYAISKIPRLEPSLPEPSHSNDKILNACKGWLRNISVSCMYVEGNSYDDVDFRFIQRFAQEKLCFTMKQDIQRYSYPLNPTAESFGGFNK